jgi:polar amino acid transport system substrate-binding protein
MMSMRIALFSLMLSLLGLPVKAEPLRFVVDTSVSLPYAKFEQGQLKSGLSYQLGLDLAQRLGREAVFVPVARKRINSALESGQADLICGYASAWLPGPFQWSLPIARHSELLITRADVPAPQHLEELAGQAIGSIAGFRYVVLERQLGANFIRDDGPDAEALMRRLAAKRISHAIVSRSYLDYQRQVLGFNLALHPPLLLEQTDLRCALSQKSALPLSQLDEALRLMLKDGSLHIQH